MGELSGDKPGQHSNSIQFQPKVFIAFLLYACAAMQESAAFQIQCSLIPWVGVQLLRAQASAFVILSSTVVKHRHPSLRSHV